MPTNSNARSKADETAVYEIRLEGHLDRQFTDWFEGMTVTQEANGETILAVRVADQAELHGVLKKVRNVGIPLISLHRVDPDQAEVANARTG